MSIQQIRDDFEAWLWVQKGIYNTTMLADTYVYEKVQWLWEGYKGRAEEDI